MHRDFHVEVAKSLYSVHYTLVGQTPQGPARLDDGEALLCAASW